MNRAKRGKLKKIKNISLYILEKAVLVLDDSLELIDCCVDKKKLYTSVYTGYPTKTDYSLTDFARHLSVLRKGGYIKDVDSDKQNNNSSIELTNKAKLKVVDKISKRIESDGKFRFVSWDIPEKIRKNRNQFRTAIKRMGFVQIQKSLWVIDKNVTDLVEMAAYEYKVEKFIAYIVSEKSDIDGIIEKKLKHKKS